MGLAPRSVSDLEREAALTWRKETAWLTRSASLGAARATFEAVAHGRAVPGQRPGPLPGGRVEATLDSWVKIADWRSQLARSSAVQTATASERPADSRAPGLLVVIPTLFSAESDRSEAPGGRT